MTGQLSSDGHTLCSVVRGIVLLKLPIFSTEEQISAVQHGFLEYIEIYFLVRATFKQDQMTHTGSAEASPHIDILVTLDSIHHAVWRVPLVVKSPNFSFRFEGQRKS